MTAPRPGPAEGSRNITVSAVPQGNGGAGLMLRCAVHPGWEPRWAGDEHAGAEIPLGVAVAQAYAHMVDYHPQDTTPFQRQALDNLRRRPGHPRPGGEDRSDG